ncbi:MAG: site-specific integrase [Chloroflexi bacterium]|nr:site-specific integrase [Chloroflexota bacterium]
MSDAQQLPLFEGDHLTPNTPLNKAVRPFLEYLRGEGKSPNTLTSFRSDLNLLGQFLEQDVIPLKALSTRRLNEFLHWLEHGRGIPCSRKSYARRVTTLKVFFKWLHDTKVLRDDPAAALIQRSGPAPLQQILSPQEIEQALSTARQLRRGDKSDARPYTLFVLLLETGIKKSETVLLTTADIENRDSENPQISVRYKRQNVFKERRLPVSYEWLAGLDEYLDQYAPEDNLIFDCTPRNLEYVLSDLTKAAGIDTRISFEAMRWTSAVRDYLGGMDMDDLREKMGLSEISWRETSQKIIKLANAQLAGGE